MSLAIRWRLTIWIAAVLLLVLTAMFLSLRFSLDSVLSSDLDGELSRDLGQVSAQLALVGHPEQAELEEMRQRIVAMRAGLAALDPALGFLTAQKGMFSTLDLTPDQIRRLREDHAVYTAGARINIAGLVPSNLAAFAEALAAVR